MGFIDSLKAPVDLGSELRLFPFQVDFSRCGRARPFAGTPIGFLQDMSMLTLSYATAAAVMFAAILYLFLRLRMFLTTTTMLVGSLLLIYGPACLIYTLSSGEPNFVMHRLYSGYRIPPVPHPIFGIIQAKVSDLSPVVTAMNFSISLMFLGIIAGIEAVDRLMPKRAATMMTALTNWNAQALHDEVGGHRTLLIVIVAALLIMSFFSITENHVATIWKFLSIKDDNFARDAFRLHYGGSPNYFYRLILGAVAPMLVIWGLIAGWSGKSWSLLLATLLLFIVTMIGKADTLSKAPAAFFLIQLMVAVLLTITNRVTWRSTLGAVCGVALVLYAVTRLVMIFPEGTEIFKVVYFRVFEATNQALLENFATFPFVHPYMWGTNIRPVAILMGLPYLPAFSIVAHTWYGTYDVTSNALFIADAWADFSYLGVTVFGLIAGAVCRSIDVTFLANGKTVVGVAVLGAAFFGIFTLLVTSLNAALFSGGLLLAPILAGLLVTASRYLNRRHPTTPAEHAV
jgi:hypothetical protein